MCGCVGVFMRMREVKGQFVGACSVFLYEGPGDYGQILRIKSTFSC